MCKSVENFLFFFQVCVYVMHSVKKCEMDASPPASERPCQLLLSPETEPWRWAARQGSRGRLHWAMAQSQHKWHMWCDTPLIKWDFVFWLQYYPPTNTYGVPRPRQQFGPWSTFQIRYQDKSKVHKRYTPFLIILEINFIDTELRLDWHLSNKTFFNEPDSSHE